MSIRDEVIASILIETSLADNTCSNPECPGRSGHDGPCWDKYSPYHWNPAL